MFWEEECDPFYAACMRKRSLGEVLIGSVDIENPMSKWPSIVGEVLSTDICSLFFASTSEVEVSWR